MKKLTSLILVTFLMFTLIFSGCGQDAGQTAAEQKPDEGAAQQQEVIELKLNDWNPPGIYPTIKYEDLSKMVEEKTNGRIKIKAYLAGSLVKYPETYKGVSSGVSDISAYIMGGMPGVHKLNEIFDLPFLGFKDFDQAHRIYKEILAEFPELQAENEAKNVRMLSVRPMAPYALHSVSKPVRVPSDLKGEKLIATGYLGSLATTSGGIAMQTSSTDWYSSLQKGVVQHILGHFPVVDVFKLDELTKYHTIFGEGGICNSGFAHLINLDTWNKLTPEDQQILVEAFDWYIDELQRHDSEDFNAIVERMKSEGHEFIELTPEEIQQWKDTAGKPVIEKWIEETEASGLPAQEVYDAIQKKIAEDK